MYLVFANLFIILIIYLNLEINDIKIMSKELRTKKQTGATFTPSLLANFISEKIVEYLNTEEKEITILDPSCGDGVLLYSLSKIIGRDIRLIGYDINEDYINNANKLLKKDYDKIELFHQDFLESIDITSNQMSILDNALKNHSVDIVIANPPYVRTQNLGSKYSKYISKKFKLKGKIDLYFPFLISMTHSLKDNGIIGVITSNKFLYNKSGASIRKFLFENYEILEIIDLGDTKLFDAAVLPSIFIGRKKRGVRNDLASFTKFYQLFDYDGAIDKELDSIYDLLRCTEEGIYQINSEIYQKTKGAIRFESSKENNWILLNRKESTFIDQIEKKAEYRIKDFFRVRVGIKTTADKVFIKDKWENEDIIPEKELLYDLISQENINQWTINEKLSLKVLYPHFDNNKKKGTIDLFKYPKASEYLSKHYDVLSKREYIIKAKRNWFEIWVPQNPYLWKLPKVVFPDISVEPRFSFDSSGKIVNGNCYWIVAENESDVDKLYLIQGIANSELMQKYHSLMFNNKLYSGRKRYFAQYIENYPLPSINNPLSLMIIDIVKKLNLNKKSISKDDLTKKLNELVYKVYEISEGK